MIFSIIGIVWRFKKPILIGVLIFAIVAYIAILKFQVRSAIADVVDAGQERDAAMAEAMKWRDAADQYAAANRENQAAFDEYKKHNAEWSAIAQKQINAAVTQTKIINEIRKEIQNAPEHDNRIVGPILNSALDCLRRLQAGAADCRR